MAAGIALPGLLREGRAAELPRFGLGVASGRPRPDGIVLWTRLTGPALPPEVEVRWELAADPGFATVAVRGSERAVADDAHSVHAEVAGLTPGRAYWYRFTALGQRSPTGRTRTAPASDARTTLRLAIACCQRYDHGHYAAWRHVSGEDLDLVVFLGDYIYEYPSRPGAIRRHDGGLVRTLEQYRQRYEQYRSDPALQAAHAAFPWWVIWDDHEVENDYAGRAPTTPLGADLRTLRRDAYRAWWEHMPVPRALRPDADRLPLFTRADWGALARLHLLDTRQYRDEQACPPTLRLRGAATVMEADCPALGDPARSMLGAEQERWLAEGWDPRRPWNLVAQTTLMARLSSHAQGRVNTDGWDGYRAARQRLLAGAAERRLGGLVVLSGDIHAHVVADLKSDFGAARTPVIGSEFCTTSISSHGRSQRALEQALALNPHLHHGRADQRGYIALTVDERRVEARLMAVDRPEDPASAVRESARFTVEAGRPGPQRG